MLITILVLSWLLCWVLAYWMIKKAVTYKVPTEWGTQDRVITTMFSITGPFALISSIIAYFVIKQLAKSE